MKSNKRAPVEYVQHPDHSSEMPRLKRIIGQMEGIERMVLERRYCPDILQQLRAVQSAVKALELQILKTHLSSCIRAAAQNEKSSVFDEKLKEFLDLIKN
jgi:DNA-binding FrmR family transcriptional regulator